MAERKPTLAELLKIESAAVSAKKSSYSKGSTTSSAFSTVKDYNYMNIRHSKVQNWMGQNGNKQGFVTFEKPEFSVRAFYKILSSYNARGVNTIEKIAETYAPRKEGNDPEKYIRRFISYMEQLGYTISRKTPIPPNYYVYLAKVFMFIESGVEKDIEWFKKIYNLYF